LFRNEPPQRTQTGRGKVRKVASKPGRAAAVSGAVVAGVWFMKQKTLPTFRRAGLKAFPVNYMRLPCPRHFLARGISTYGAAGHIAAEKSPHPAIRNWVAP